MVPLSAAVAGAGNAHRPAHQFAAGKSSTKPSDRTDDTQFPQTSGSTRHTWTIPRFVMHRFYPQEAIVPTFQTAEGQPPVEITGVGMADHHGIDLERAARR